MQVNRAGTLLFDASGLPSQGQPGPWVAHYTYDGLGRLIRRQQPWDGGTGTTPEGNGAAIRIESYLYDGLRRVQEVFTDPVVHTGPKKIAKGSEPPPEGGEPWVYTAREYVYAPPSAAGGGGGVDEFVLEWNEWDGPAYVLQDAGLDAVALADAAGRVVWQGVYSPYGEVLRSEGLISAEDSRIGHHGLFFDRFGAAAGEATLVPGAGGLGAGTGVGAGGVYHTRHRGYTPGTGRFMQEDPNATGLALAADPMWHSGMAPSSMGPGRGFDALRHYGDGMGRYVYVGENPLTRGGPLGLMEFSLGAFTQAAAIRGAIAGGAVGGIIGGMSGGISASVQNKSVSRGVIAGFVGGAIAGALSGGFTSGFASAGSVYAWGAPALSGGIGSVTEGLINEDTPLELLLDFLTGGIGGALGKGLGSHFGNNFGSDTAEQIVESMIAPSGWGYVNAAVPVYRQLDWRRDVRWR